MANLHFIELDWERTELTSTYSFAPDWTVELNLFYDIKDMDAHYTLPDGTPYTNPLGNIHHRDETLRGMADLRLLLNHWWRGILFEGDTLHVGAGFTLPTGEIEKNPYDLATAGLKHQHIQFGNGTIDPLLRADYSLVGDPLGFGLSLGLHAPLYENRNDYKGPTLLQFSAGPRLDFNGDVSINFRYTSLYQTRGTWDGDIDPNSGYFLQGISLSTPIRLSPVLTLIPTLMRIYSIDTRGNSDTFEMDTMIAVTLNISFGGKSGLPSPVEGGTGVSKDEWGTGWRK